MSAYTTIRIRQRDLNRLIGMMRADEAAPADVIARLLAPRERRSEESPAHRAVRQVLAQADGPLSALEVARRSGYAIRTVQRALPECGRLLSRGPGAVWVLA